MTWYTLNNILLPLCVYHYYGLKQLLVFFSSAFISVMILEIVNYLEHYGLQRKEIRKGVYEKVNINHSWNAP
jgi:alkane 1-monooxygenase